MAEGLQPPSNDELWREVDELKSRVASLEAARNEATTPPNSKSIDIAPQPLATPAGLHQAIPSSRSRQGDPSPLEAKIGAQLFNRVGVFAVLAGAAWFLKLAMDRAWIGPGIRVAVGLVVAVLLVVWSERFRHTGATVFSNTLKALGSGIAYLSLWAAVNLYQLFPDSVAFLAMVAVTVTNAILAWWQDSELLAALALGGAIATPALLTNGGNRELFLFSYLLLIDVGILVLIALRAWPRLAIAAFVGSTGYLAVWWIRFYSEPSEMLTAIFMALFFTVFTLVPLLALRRKTAVNPDGLLIGFPVAVGLCAFIEGEALLASVHESTDAWLVAIVLGAIYLALTWFLPSASMQSPRLATPLRVVHLSLAVGFFALSGWLHFHGFGIPLSWLVLVAIVAGTAVRLKLSELSRPLRWNASALLLLSFLGLLLLDFYNPHPRGTSAFFNAHFAVYLAGLAAFAAVIALSRSSGKPETLPRFAYEVDSWAFLAGFATIAFNVIALLAVSLQIELFWRQQLPAGPGGIPPVHQPAYVDFTYSAWFMLYGAALMATGFLRRSAFLRWQALVLICVSIGKVFLFDINHLNEGYRVFSFLGLGVLLLAISFAYQRDWLELRGKTSQIPTA